MRNNYLYAGLTALLLSTSLLAEKTEVSIIPQPTTISYADDSQLVITPPLTLKDADKWKSLKQQIRIETTAKKTAQPLSLSLNKVGWFSPNPDSYMLTVTDKGINLTASDRKGIINGISTINQLLLQGKKKNTYHLPQLTIFDEPRFSHRGLMLDSSRHIQSVAGIKRLLDQMALLKLNVFHWHLTDHNGWRAEIPSYPKLAKVGGFLNKTSSEIERNGYYTVKQMKEIANYANARGIEVIPEIDVPGHASALIEAYPEFACPTHKVDMPSKWIHNKGPRGTESDAYSRLSDKRYIVCASNTEVMDFLITVFKEVAAATNAKRVHIGGDEVAEGIWSNCPKCTAHMKKHGFKHEHELEKQFLTILTDRLNEEGIKTINWTERPKTGMPKVDATIIWRGNEKDELKTVTSMGIPALNAHGKFAYYDYPEFPNSPKPSWMPPRSTEQSYKFPVMEKNMTAKEQSLVLGGLCCLWTENVIEKKIDEMLYPRTFAFAEQMWTSEKNKNYDQFSNRLNKLKPLLMKEGMKFAQPHLRENILSIRGANVTTNMPKHRALWPEYAFDQDDTTCFMTNRPGKEGDQLTVSLGQAERSKNTVTVITGNYYYHDEDQGQAVHAVLEASNDNKNWSKLADFKDGEVKNAKFDKDTKHLRIRLTKDQERRLVVSEFVVK